MTATSRPFLAEAIPGLGGRQLQVPASAIDESTAATVLTATNEAARWSRVRIECTNTDTSNDLVLWILWGGTDRADRACWPIPKGDTRVVIESRRLRSGSIRVFETTGAAALNVYLEHDIIPETEG